MNKEKLLISAILFKYNVPIEEAKIVGTYIEQLENQNEEYKNVIKEAIKLIEDNWITYEDSKQFTDFNESLSVFIKEINDLLNILNKGSDK